MALAEGWKAGLVDPRLPTVARRAADGKLYLGFSD